jgi:hypothetical protein
MTRRPGAAGGRMTSVERRSTLRRLILLGTLLALAILEILHQQPGSVGESVEQGGGSCGSTV